MTLKLRVIVGAAILSALSIPAVAFANDGDQDRVQVFQSIEVGPDEQVGDVVCVFCSIRMAGTAKGDTVAVLGSIIVDGRSNGDVVAVGGSIKLGEDASVGGDTVGLGGGVSRHPNATVKGSIVSQANPLISLGLMVGLIVVPLLPIALIVWLIIWLLRSNRPPGYAQAQYRR